jgi:hypothetical protein
MIGVPKLLLAVLVIIAVWYAVRWINRKRPTEMLRRTVSPAQPVVEAEDLVPCPVCGTYIAASARSCGRPTCPRPR